MGGSTWASEVELIAKALKHGKDVTAITTTGGHDTLPVETSEFKQ